MRRPLIVGNWKMNLSLSDAHVLAKVVKNSIEKFPQIEVAICPPFPWLVPIKEELSLSPLKLGAQNIHPEAEGPFTGEISSMMLKGIAEYVLVGHSERRSHFKEDNHFVNLKVLECLRTYLKPILCVGEEKKLNLDGLTQQGIEQRFFHSKIAEEIKKGLKGVKGETWRNITVAYEPVWAIGTGNNAEGRYAGLIAHLIRDLLINIAGETLGQTVRILYGGSVNKKNVIDYALEVEIDGLLVGGASLKASEFLGICEVIAKHSKY